MPVLFGLFVGCGGVAVFWLFGGLVVGGLVYIVVLVFGFCC